MRSFSKAKTLSKSVKRTARRAAQIVGKISVARSLRGIIKNADYTLATIREERLAKYFLDS